MGFAKEGAKVIGLSRSTDSGEETARLVREAGSDALFISTDIQKLEDVEAAMAQGIAAFGRLDIAVNSAGVRVNGAAADLSEQDWDTALGTNLKGAFLVTRAAIPEMRRAGGGVIINISAASGFHGTKGRVAYSTSKGALNNFTEATALDYAEDDDAPVGAALSRLGEHIYLPLPGNFQSMPDFRVFIDRDLFLVKPIGERFWLRSAALADASAIALDLHEFTARRHDGRLDGA